MSDQEIITLDSDDEGDASMADLVVGPTGTAVPIGEARKHGLTARLPLPPGMSARSRPPHAAGHGRNVKLPKKPGAFPPFALFSQERRDKVLQENKDITFTEVGKKMGELWHTLTEEEKEDYRKRAREIADQKLKDWHEKMKEFPQMASQYTAQAAVAAQKRRRTHGYAIFSSEMRKKFVGDNVTAADMTKIIAEQWRNASPAIRQTYEARAAKINEVEAKKYQQIVQQNQRRQQMVAQNQRLQQQKQHHMMQQQQQLRAFSRSQQHPGGQLQRHSDQGLRISAVSSLSQKQIPSRGVNLPSSITISRVEPEPVLDTPNIPPGLSIQRMRGPPPLMRGGMPQQLQQRGRLSLPPQRQLQQQHQQMYQQQQMLQKQQLVLQQRQQQGLMRPRPSMPGRMGSLQMSGIKRPLPHAGIIGVPNKQPRLLGSVSQGSNQALQPGLIIAARLCRLCGHSGPYNFYLKDKPETAEAVKFVLGLDMDLSKDKEQGLPDTICRKCTTVLSTYSLFKKSVETGQTKLKTISQEKKRKLEEAEAMKAELASRNSSELSILPDLDCDVDFGENPKNVPQPSAEISFKAESLEDELEKQQNVAKTNGKQGASHDDETGNGNGLIDEDDVIDPLMFIQVSHVESNYEDFNEEGGDLHDGDEAMEIEEHLEEHEDTEHLEPELEEPEQEHEEGKEHIDEHEDTEEHDETEHVESEQLEEDEEAEHLETEEQEEEVKHQDKECETKANLTNATKPLEAATADKDLKSGDNSEHEGNDNGHPDELEHEDGLHTEDEDGLEDDFHAEEIDTPEGEDFNHEEDTQDGEFIDGLEGESQEGHEKEDTHEGDSEDGHGNEAESQEGHDEEEAHEGDSQDGHGNEGDSGEHSELDVDYELEEEEEDEPVTVDPNLVDEEHEEEGHERLNLHSALADSDAEVNHGEENSNDCADD